MRFTIRCTTVGLKQLDVLLCSRRVKGHCARTLAPAWSSMHQEAVVKIAAPLTKDPNVHRTKESTESANGRRAQRGEAEAKVVGGELSSPSLCTLIVGAVVSLSRMRFATHTRVLDSATTAPNVAPSRKRRGRKQIQHSTLLLTRADLLMEGFASPRLTARP